MKNLSNIYIDIEYNSDYLLKIYSTLVRNKIPKKDCENPFQISNWNLKNDNRVKIIEITIY